jgi:low temperature requirement protein LtrA
MTADPGAVAEPPPARSGPEPLVRPPSLDLEREGNASRLELFFDLAYVLVVLELVSAFVDDLTWHGLLVLAGLFVVIWFSWVGFTLYANRFGTEDVVFRVAKLAATLAVAGCAASASEAVGKYAVPFAASFLLGRLILLGLYVRAWRHVPDGRPTIRVYLLCLGVASALWAVSLVVPGEARYLVWAVAVLVDAVGPVLATLREDKLPLHIEHLPERFALLVILVLGEGVGGVVRGVHDAAWAAPAVLVGVVGFVVVAALWWIYFDVGGARSAGELEDVAEEAQDSEDDAADERHDLFVYGHLPITFGVVLTGIGIEELALHPEDPLPSAYGWLLASGVAVFLVGVAMILGGTFRSLRSVWPWPLAAVPLVLLAALLPLPGALAFTGIFAVGLLVVAATGTARSRNRNRQALGG